MATDLWRECEGIRQEKQRAETEARQLKAVYDQLVQETREEQRELEELRASCQETTELSTKIEGLKQELTEVIWSQELEKYRVLEEERKKWETRETKLLWMVEELQRRGDSEEQHEHSGGEKSRRKESQSYSTRRVRISEPAAVSGVNEQSLAINTHIAEVQCYSCGVYGQYHNRCPSRGKEGPAETTGRDQRGKAGNGHVANLVLESSQEQHQKEDGVHEALEKVLTTMHSIISDASAGKLGPVPKTRVNLEGEPVDALMDTGSPVTIVSLDFLLRAWVRNRPPEQSPQEWRGEPEKRLEPTPVILKSYGGERLPVVGQAQTHLSRPGHEVDAVIQVQREAPAELLIGTDLLSELGFLLVSTQHAGSR